MGTQPWIDAPSPIARVGLWRFIMGNSYKFNTADYEEVLVEAGLDKPLAKAHRVALEEALEQVVTVDKLDQAVARIEAAISNQSARFDLAIANQNTKFEAALANQARNYVAWVALIVGVVGALIKFG
jgi:hypothetical protein